MQPTTLILFGGTGDLTKRKLLPAFATLLRQEKLASGSLLIGVGRRPLTHEMYKQSLITDLSAEDQACLKDLQILYFPDDVTKPTGLIKLPAFLQEHEQKSSNRLYYLATSYTLFPHIVQALHRTHLDKQNEGWTRIVFEKPFGHDLASSDALDKAKKRLGERANEVRWIVSDLKEFETDDKYNLWHDRAVLHFLTAEDDIGQYVDRVRRFLKPEGYLIVSAFSVNGPKRCSGLEVMQYSEDSLKKLFSGFECIESFEEEHVTPLGASQIFICSMFKKQGDKNEY